MILPDRLFAGDWVRDARLRRLPRHVQLLLVFLRSLCDRYGKFEYDPKDLHRLLYVGVEDNVSARDVEAWLELLRSGGFIKAYIGVEGRQVGEISRPYWRQTLKYGKARFDPGPEEEGLPLAGGPSPAPPKEEKRSDVKQARAQRTPTHDDIFDREITAADLVALAEKWPEHDIAKAVRNARAYLRRERGEDAKLMLEWFEKHWMPREPKRRLAEVVPMMAEPERFREWFRNRYEQEAPDWAKLGDEHKVYYFKQMKGAGAA